MALTRQQANELLALVEAYAARTDQLVQETAASITALYAGASFYTASQIKQVSEEAADQSNTAQLVAAGLASQYLAMILSVLTGGAVPVPNIPVAPIRNGTPLPDVFERPMKFYRRKLAEAADTGRRVDPDEAFHAAMRLAENLADGNIRLAQRDHTAVVMDRLPEELGITGYRRVVHPELSETGTCGLCITASDVKYKRAELMPLHDRCKCTVAPIIGDLDPGSALNNLSLADLYQGAADATGSRRTSGTHGWDLKKIRYVVNEHGEWGPVLTVAGQTFTGPDDLAPAA